MSVLDERRAKRRRKGETVQLADITGSEAPATVQAAAPAPDHINFAAYLRHVASQEPERRAVAAGVRSIAGGLEWRALTFAQLDAESDALARGFSGHGWGLGQRVYVSARPDADVLAAVLGLLKLGAVPVLLEPGRTRDDLAACAAAQPAAVLMTDLAGLRNRLGPKAPLRGGRKIVLATPWPKRAILGVESLGSLRRADGARVPLAATRPMDAALVLMSAVGATPRAVVLDHAALIAQAELLRKSQKLIAGEVAIATDLHHALLLLAIGMTVVTPGVPHDASARTVGHLVDCVDGSGATIAIGPVSTWRAVADRLAREGRMLPGLRTVLLVGGPASVATHEVLGRILPAGESRDLYSLTEAVAVASIAGGDVLGETRALTEKGGGHCVGAPLPGVDVAILDFGAAGAPVALGEVGEIVVRGASVAPHESRTHSDPTGAWMRTGDLGWADRQGRLWIVGRVARTVHSRFGPVFNGAAEGVFEAHPSVRRCALIGLGKFGQQEALLVVEPVEGAHPKDDTQRASLERDILKLGAGQALTRDVRRVLFVKKMPSDGRSGSAPRASDVVALASKES